MDVTELPSFARQLKVLGYGSSLDIFSVSSTCALARWLDKQYFGVGDEGGEDEAVIHALGESLGSPFAFQPPFSDLQRATLVEFLLNQAVSYKYAKLEEQETSVEMDDALYVALCEGLSRSDSESLITEARELGRELGLTVVPNDEREARELLLACVRQAIRVKSRKARDDSAGSEFLPLNASKASDLLRLLYCEDAAEQEKATNALLVRLQNLTASPVVDASLGKGGLF